MAPFSNMFGHRPDTAPGYQPPKKRSIGNSDSLLEEEFAPHFNAWKEAPDEVTSGNLLKAVDPVIQSALRTYAGTSQSSPNLKSRAKLLVLNSLPRYDAKQAKLRTYLMSNLQSLRRAQAEEAQIISTPERVRLEQQKLHTATGELVDRLGRQPSTAELSRHTGVPLKRLAHLNKAMPVLAEGQVTSLDDEGNEISATESIIQPPKRAAYLDFIYGDLGPVDQFILERSMGLHGHRPMPKGKIAAKLGLSASAVSQRAAKIQAIIDRHEGGGIF